MGIAHVPDGRGTFTQLSVEDNLRLGAYTRRDKEEVAGKLIAPMIVSATKGATASAGVDPLGRRAADARD